MKTTTDKIRYFENQRIRAIERGADRMEMDMIEQALETCYREFDNIAYLHKSSSPEKSVWL